MLISKILKDLIKFIFRYLATTDYFAAAAGYRTLAGTYYPDYHAAAALGNGYLDAAGSRIPSLASYDQVF